MSVNNIYALSSGNIKSGVSIVRLSGCDVPKVMNYIGHNNLIPRKVQLTHLIDPLTNEKIDHCLLLYFPAPYSFTGEHILEFHLHGSKAVIEHLFKVLNDTGLCRMAEAGEFLRRAFKNNKLDLTRIEAIAAILNSETMAQKQQALKQLNGFTANIFNNIRSKLLKSLSLLEVIIDFPEENQSNKLLNKIYAKVLDIKKYISKQLFNFTRNVKLNDGFNIAIIGAPNVGKSSLMNLLIDRNVAIVSSEAGTTRDIIKARLNIDGYIVNLLDTAGIRDTKNLIEIEGVKRTKQLIKEADFIIAVFDDILSYNIIKKNKFNKSILIRNKIDIYGDNKSYSEVDLHISVKKNKNIDSIINIIKKYLNSYFKNVEDDIVTCERHKILLKSAQLNIIEFLENKFLPEEILAEFLRAAILKIGKITSYIDVEEVLDEIFLNFCIGK